MPFTPTLTSLEISTQTPPNKFSYLVSPSAFLIQPTTPIGETINIINYNTKILYSFIVESVRNNIINLFYPEYHSPAKAWVIFNGTQPIGSNLSAVDSYNISNISKSAVGTYTISFINGFTNTGYVPIGSSNGSPGTSHPYTLGFSNISTNSLQTRTYRLSGTTVPTQYDSTLINIQVFGN